MRQKQGPEHAPAVNPTGGVVARSAQLQRKGDPESSLRLHAAKMQQEYAALDPSAPCQLCGWLPPQWRLRLDWLAIYNTKEDVVRSAAGLAALLAIGHGETFQHQARFSTYHGCCADCYRRLLLRRAVSVMAEKLCVVVLALGMIGAVAALMYGTTLRSNPTSQSKLIFLVAVGVALAGLTGGLGLPKVLRRWRTPKPLRSVGLWPYTLERSQRSRID